MIELSDATPQKCEFAKYQTLKICGCAVSPFLRYDIWERSYRNARPKYLEAFVDNLINWEYVAEMFDKA